MASKHYYLFGIKIWSVIIEIPETEEVEEIEDDPDGTNTTLSAAITLSADDKPAFGFTPWTPEPWGDYED